MEQWVHRPLLRISEVIMIKKVLKDTYQVLGVDASYGVVKRLDEQSGWVVDLYDADGKLLASDRDFPVGWAPFPDLNEGEVEYLEGKPPRKGWLKALTQRWMREHQTMFDEDGKVLKEDPLYFTTRDTEDQLLAKVDAFLNPVTE